MRQSFTTIAASHTIRLSAEKLFIPRQVNCKRESKNIMGDRSPKANQKKTTQKQSKTAGIAATKKAAVVSKQAAGKKK